MSSLERAPADFSSPGLIVMDAGTRRVNFELVQLCHSVMRDPKAITYIKQENSVEKRISHSKSPDITLQAVIAHTTENLGQSDLPYRTSKDSANNHTYKNTYIQLGVFEPDNSAAIFCIESRRLPFQDIQNDPFATYIMDIFRGHLAANYPLTHN